MYMRPKVKLDTEGPGANVFALIAKVEDALKSTGYFELEQRFRSAVFQANSYEEALWIMRQYVEDKE